RAPTHSYCEPCQTGRAEGTQVASFRNTLRRQHGGGGNAVSREEDLEDSKSCRRKRCSKGHTERACDDGKQELRGEGERWRQADDLALKQRSDDVAFEKMHENE